MKQIVDVAIPVITFRLLMTVGLDLTREDFASVRRQPAVVLSGVLAAVAMFRRNSPPLTPATPSRS